MKLLNLKIASLAWVLFMLPLAQGTTEGIPENYAIQGHTRPCCSFVRGAIGRAIGVFRITTAERMGIHRFGGWRKEKRGLTYACKAGFIDTSHMRDNIDWTGHLMKVLPEIIGTEEEYPIRKEHVKRSLYLKAVPSEVLNTLSIQDYALIAQRISYDLSVWHELLTGMGISSFDPTDTFTDELSTFSVEDNFSNLLGTYIGVEAVLSPLPFNEAVSVAIQENLRELETVSYYDTQAAHYSVFNDWWRKGSLIKPDIRQVTKRQMDPYAPVVTTFRIPEPEVAGCAPLTGKAKGLVVPRVTTMGFNLGDFYEIRIKLSKKIRRYIAPHIAPVPMYLTEKDFPLLISVLKERYLDVFDEGFDRE